MITTTAFSLDGQKIVQTLGMVRGITVRTRSLPLTILGGLAMLIGGRSPIFSNLCEQARAESYQLMIKHAEQMGANAIIAVRYDTGPMSGAAEVLCYGTAVIIEPIFVAV